jgi:hypothetical protein
LPPAMSHTIRVPLALRESNHLPSGAKATPVTGVGRSRCRGAGTARVPCPRRVLDFGEELPGLLAQALEANGFQVARHLRLQGPRRQRLLVGVLQPGHRLRLAVEARLLLRRGVGPGQHQLEGHQALKLVRGIGGSAFSSKGRFPLRTTRPTDLQAMT